jgi:hypothetical protein
MEIKIKIIIIMRRGTARHERVYVLKVSIIIAMESAAVLN